MVSYPCWGRMGIVPVIHSMDRYRITSPLRCQGADFVFWEFFPRGLPLGLFLLFPLPPLSLRGSAATVAIRYPLACLCSHSPEALAYRYPSPPLSLSLSLSLSPSLSPLRFASGMLFPFLIAFSRGGSTASPARQSNPKAKPDPHCRSIKNATPSGGVFYFY